MSFTSFSLLDAKIAQLDKTDSIDAMTWRAGTIGCPLILLIVPKYFSIEPCVILVIFCCVSIPLKTYPAQIKI